MTTRTHDRFVDAVRAGALLVVVLGHWFATLPRVEMGRTVGAEHLLHSWGPASVLTWILQVVPVFVLVSAAVTTPALPGGRLQWWSSRALRLARPTITYLAVLAALWAFTLVDQDVDGFVSLFSGSLTVHLWFLAMLLAVQAALPAAVRADAHFGLWAVVGLAAAVIVLDIARAGGISDLALGEAVVATSGGVGWLNVVVAWLIPQQLGVAWKTGRLSGRRAGAGLLLFGVCWLVAATSVGYPTAMVGGDLAGNSNVLPPTAALPGVMWVQAGLVLLVEDPARRLLERPRAWRCVQVLAALGMPLYLWHKLAELPAVWIANRTGIRLDAGLPGDPGFWLGRGTWIGLCFALVVPIVVAVVAYERRRRPSTELAPGRLRPCIGSVLVVAGLVTALKGGVDMAAVATVVLAIGVAVLSRRR